MNSPAGWYPDPGDPSLVRYWDGNQWSPRTAPKFSTPPPPPRRPQPSAKAAKNGKLVATGFALFVVTGVIVALIGGGSDAGDDDTGIAAATSTAASSLPSTTKSAAEVQASQQAAAASSSRAAAAAAAAAAREAERKNPAAYEQLSPRDFALIAKDSAAAKNRKIVLYGYVAQFDSVTGANQFRASVDSQQFGSWYDYDHNVIIKASDRNLIANVVEDDLVTMWVEVDEPITYDTTLGGSTTVPSFKVNMIEVTGSK
ncbi:hypothetical protein Z051_09400 [Rhodococcus rhodochrous KG-21]|uniref:DUF2510 domain-containing protein n=1 Tax=Rhodococcus rhodochrous KG-21 TaxID=1441923 RepID=A0A0M9WP95_RHORH|nr:hypothetical protein Z051_09400 [Rhodococcus rhodochrous KG-21]